MATQLEIYNESLRLMGEHSIASTSVDEEPRYVLDDAYSRSITYCLQLGWWRFAFFTTSVSPAVGSQPGYTYTFTKPTDLLRTHSVGIVSGTQFYPIDWYDTSSTQLSCKQNSGVVVRYVKGSSTQTNPANWPEPFAKLVAAYLAFETCERITQSSAKKADIGKILSDRLTAARELESQPPPMLLPEHAIEQATRQMLELGAWKWAIVTASLSGNGQTPSPPYSYRFDKPDVWMRTIRVFRLESSRECDIDYRDETNDIHANYNPIYVRYITTAAIIPSSSWWPESFRRAWEALLSYTSMQHTGAGEQQIAAAMAHWEKLLREALIKDALNERPKVYRTSSFNKSRGAYINREQGY